MTGGGAIGQGACQRGLWSWRAALLTFTAALIAAEAAALYSVEASLTCYAVIFFAILNVGVGFPSAPAQMRGAVIAFALVPTLKIAAIAMPQQALPPESWEALPAFVGLVLALGLRAGGEPGQAIALGVPKRVLETAPAQLAIAATGPVMAAVAAAAYSSLSPAVPSPGPTATPVSVLATAALSGVTLEVVFRGVIQRSLSSLFGPIAAVVVSTILYAGIHVGSGSVFVVILGLCTGAVWGSLAARTGTLTGVATSHALFAMVWAVSY